MYINIYISVCVGACVCFAVKKLFLKFGFLFKLETVQFNIFSGL